MFLHSSLVDPDCMPQASQWSRRIVILAGQAGQGNASLTEILLAAVISAANAADAASDSLRGGGSGGGTSSSPSESSESSEDAVTR